jgi:hypothetical protein
VANSSVVLTLNSQEYTINRAALRLWLQLEEHKDRVTTSAESGNIKGIVDAVYSYLSAVLLDDIEYSELPWYEVIEAFYHAVSLNMPSFEFPFLQSVLDNSKFSWDYEGRTWYIWLNILSSRGWTVEYISELDIDDAIGIAQEIAIERQLDLETQWALSEKSVSYNEQGKGKFNPLERPAWMRPLPREIKPGRIPKHMLPQGMIISWNKDEPTKPN